MQTTIDAAGRIVVPKPLREAMGLAPGASVDIVFTDGRIEIELAPIDAEVDTTGDLPLIVPHAKPAPLTDSAVRATLESARR